MKLASLKSGRDGKLVVVSRDLSRAVSAEDIAPTLQAAMDNWATCETQLVELFDIAQVGKAASRFDQAKLDWLNAHYLRSSAPQSLCADVMRRLRESGVDASEGPELDGVIAALQERSKNLTDLATGAAMFYTAPESYDEKAVKKNFKDGTSSLLEGFMKGAEALNSWDKDGIHQLLESCCEQAEVKLGKLAQPIRILVAGVPVSPPIDTTLALLGKAESLTRIRRGMESLRP